jgi:5-methylcytosine-specific restriction endonuclease McrA
MVMKTKIKEKNDTCSVKGCERKLLVKRNRLCRMHYTRWYRNGEAGEVALRKKPNGTYSKLINGKLVWHLGKKPSYKYPAYTKEYVKMRRSNDPNYAKSIYAMHKARFGGLRRKVLKRDHYTCQICGMTNEEHKEKWGCEITLDHLDGTGRYSDNHNNSEDNLWALCLSCHGRRDVYRWLLSRGKTVPTDLIETLRLE